MTHTQTRPPVGSKVTITLTGEVIEHGAGELFTFNNDYDSYELVPGECDSIEVHQRPWQAGDKVRGNSGNEKYVYILGNGGYIDLYCDGVWRTTTVSHEEVFPHDLFELAE